MNAVDIIVITKDLNCTISELFGDIIIFSDIFHLNSFFPIHDVDLDLNDIFGLFKFKVYA